MRPDTLQDRVKVAIRHFKRRNEETAIEPRIDVFADHLEPRHAEGLMPESHVSIAETIAGPFKAAQCGRPANFQLVAIGKGHKRLACRAARRDPENLLLVVIVRQQTEIQMLSDRLLRQQWYPANIVDPAQVLRP